MTPQRTTYLILIVAVGSVLPGCTPSLAFLHDVREHHHKKHVWSPNHNEGPKVPPDTEPLKDKAVPAEQLPLPKGAKEKTAAVACPACQRGLPGPHAENCPRKQGRFVNHKGPQPKSKAKVLQAPEFKADVPPQIEQNSASTNQKGAPKNDIRLSDYPPKANAKVPAVMVSKTGAKESKPPQVDIDPRPPFKTKGTQAPPQKSPKVHKLAMVFEKFLLKDPTAAIKLMEGYDPQNQEFYLRLLPLLAALEGKPMGQLTPEEYASLTSQLEGVISTLRSHAAFQIDEMCVCKEIQGYGSYTPWPEGHTFRASDAAHRGGDCVQVYVQFRNLIPVFQDGAFSIRLSSSAELLDANGAQVWYYNFGDKTRPLRSQQKRRDYFLNYSFFMPHVPPGRYTLRIQVRDLTRSGQSRVAQRSVTIDVGQ